MVQCLACLVSVLVLGCLLVACDSQPEATSAPDAAERSHVEESAEEAPDRSAGREETRNIEAVEAVGYDSDPVRGSVDRALDENDERNQQIQEMLDE